jgi:outer membrane putative beta-barrel porin/alpha-amylase
MRLRIALATAVLSAAASAASAADGLTTLSVGVDYTTGKYGADTSTDILYVPFTGKYEIGPWTAKLVVPWIHITGPANVVGAPGDTVVIAGANAGRRTESGLGDVVASAFYNVLNERNAPFGLDLGGKIKLGTADENRGLGTGKNDYSVQADLFKPLGALTPFGSIGYRWYGDPAGVNFKNVVYWSVGTSYKLSQPTTVGVAYDFRPAIVNGGNHVSEATFFVSQKLSQDWKVQVYGVKGFSTGSPDWGAGAVLAYSY